MYHSRSRRIFRFSVLHNEKFPNRLLQSGVAKYSIPYTCSSHLPLTHPTSSRSPTTYPEKKSPLLLRQRPSKPPHRPTPKSTPRGHASPGSVSRMRGPIFIIIPGPQRELGRPRSPELSGAPTMRGRRQQGGLMKPRALCLVPRGMPGP